MAAALPVEVERFVPELIRNFAILAHVDHGKSTLADRMLELTGTIAGNKNKQVMDKLNVERERGITVKAQTSAMIWKHGDDGKEYLLNFIDTPGHSDFSYEVSRSLSACQSAILLVDACQGIQAQTVANFYQAFGQNLDIIPILNKIDLPASDVEKCTTELREAFDINDDCIQISAKTGFGVKNVLDAVIDRTAAPGGNRSLPFRGILFDSWYDSYLGVVCMISVGDGQIKLGDKVTSAATKRSYTVLSTGIMHPDQTETGKLFAGQVCRLFIFYSS